MKVRSTSKKLAIITVVYWFLLFYVVVFLIFWFVSLEKQNRQMSNYKLLELKMDDVQFEEKVSRINEEKRRKSAQYIGEGAIFLVLILVAAVYIYRATRRQFRLSIQQQNFMMAITHELKTPIAVTLLNLETLQKHRLDEARQQKLIANTIQEAKRLDVLCNNILLASQLEARAYKMNMAELNFSELVESCVLDFTTRFPARSITMLVDEQVYMIGESLLLEMMVNNLLENALKYSPRDQPVHIVLQQTLQKITLKIVDNGPGILEEERIKIFDKFYRIGNESTRHAKGTGLGLYLCKRIVQDHGGEISVRDNDPRGSVFTVVLKNKIV